MDIDTIIEKIELANYKDQIVDKLESDIETINIESVKSTIKELNERRGTLRNEKDNQALDALIARLERN